MSARAFSARSSIHDRPPSTKWAASFVIATIENRKRVTASLDNRSFAGAYRSQLHRRESGQPRRAVHAHREGLSSRVSSMLSGSILDLPSVAHGGAGRGRMCLLVQATRRYHSWISSPEGRAQGSHSHRQIQVSTSTVHFPAVRRPRIHRYGRRSSVVPSCSPSTRPTPFLRASSNTQSTKTETASPRAGAIWVHNIHFSSCSQYSSILNLLFFRHILLPSRDYLGEALLYHKLLHFRCL